MTGVFCVIPARSGSTRIAHKNIAELGGQTLLERAISTAIEAFGQVWVSTDDEAYAELARSAGALVPGLRPSELAGDDDPVEPALRHAVVAWGGDAEVVVLLQATTPFTTPDDCRRVASALRDQPSARSAVTVVRAPATTAFALRTGDDGAARFLLPELASSRTQDLPPLWLITGGAYAIRRSDLLEGATMVSEPIATVEVPADRALDIDEPADLEQARARLR